MELKQYLLEKCKKIIAGWNDTEVYLISFLVYANENSIFKDIRNFPEFSIGYNTEQDAAHAPKYSEERWNYSFWRQNEVPVLRQDIPDSAELLMEWYGQKGIANVGELSECDEYDEQMRYIGKGPIGYYELLMLVSDVARELQTDGTVKNKFGNIPIIVHDLEYSWYVKEATKNANPNGEAADFLIAFEKLFE